MAILHNVEQRSQSWYGLRAGRPTASEFSKLVTSDGTRSKSLEGYAAMLAGEKFVGRPIEGWQGNEWTERGREMEEDALRLYQFSYDVDVERVGFITDDDLIVGCSPDGLVGQDGGVEVKCLKAENHIKTILYYQKHGRCPTDYVQQTQGSLWITRRKWWDLVFYHPDLPQLVIRQLPSPELHGAIAREVLSVCNERDRIHAALVAQHNTTKLAAE